MPNNLGIHIPPHGVSDGWCSELHIDLEPWLKKVSQILISGSLLIIDYVLEARRYYNSARNDGTIMSFRNQSASTNLFLDPGYSDITAHLCLETLIYYAETNNWNYKGCVRQGQALLALGLAERLSSLQQLSNNQLDIALQRRESMLRLVDPRCFGEFRWLAFDINNHTNKNKFRISLKSKFLSDSP